MTRMDGAILREYGWPDDERLDLAQQAAEALAGIGLDREAVVLWLEAVRYEPRRFLADPLLAPLARACAALATAY